MLSLPSAPRFSPLFSSISDSKAMPSSSPPEALIAEFRVAEALFPNYFLDPFVDFFLGLGSLLGGIGHFGAVTGFAGAGGAGGKSLCRASGKGGGLQCKYQAPSTS